MPSKAFQIKNGIAKSKPSYNQSDRDEMQRLMQLLETLWRQVLKCQAVTINGDKFQTCLKLPTLQPARVPMTIFVHRGVIDSAVKAVKYPLTMVDQQIGDHRI